jgi:hypothetical protein
MESNGGGEKKGLLGCSAGFVRRRMFFWNDGDADEPAKIVDMSDDE